MKRILTIGAIVLGLAAALAVVVPTAIAKQGSDDRAGHVRHATKKGAVSKHHVKTKKRAAKTTARAREAELRHRADDTAGDDRGQVAEPGDDRGQDAEPGDDRGPVAEPGDDRGQVAEPGDDRGGETQNGDDRRGHG